MDTGNDPLSECEVVCPKCLYANPPEAAFCLQCGAPIGMVANVDPIQSIQAEGFGYRSAVEGPPQLIVLVGTWLIFLPMGAVGLFLLFAPLGNAYSFFVGLFALLVSAGILYRVTRNYRIKSREPKPREDEDDV